MKKFLLSLALIAVATFALSAAASAHLPTLARPATAVAPGPGLAAPALVTLAAVSTPAVSAIDPSVAANDIDTPVTITGAGFASDPTGTIPPTVTLGSTTLTNVAFVDSSTLTATIPWGTDRGLYTLTVRNPDGGTASLTNAFTVTQGIGQWNAGELFGGEVQQLLMKPGDPSTLYATAYGVIGLFRSSDAGEHWSFVSDKVWANNNKVAVDPLHPDWLYAFTPSGLMRSIDDGTTWTTLKDNKWPDGRDLQSPQVFVSPYEDASHPQALFVSSYASYGNPGSGALGLIRSTEGGTTWTIVPSLAGVSVQDIAFDPNDHAHLVLVTSDMKVYQSTDWGVTWTPLATTGLSPSSLGLGGSITYNPGGSEVWIDSFAASGGIFKSAASDLTAWQDVSPLPGGGSACLAFTGASSAYVPRFSSSTGGTSWDPFGPSPWYGYGWVMFDPTNASVCYIENDAVGVQKTSDGGLTWQNKVDGLTGLSCTSLAVSQSDPLRVYTTFNGPQGIYRSDDGTTTWTYLPISGAWNVRQVLADPLNSQRIYMAGDSGFYASTDGGDSWTPGGWSGLPSPLPGLFVTMAADPFQAGHLLASFGGGSYGVGSGWLYSSANYGASWQAVALPQSVNWINAIVFDPETSGTVYLATKGTGVYKSTDSGTSWKRIDDLKQPDMANAGSISIATHPQHMLLVGASPCPYRSLDGGATWQKAGRLPSGGTTLMFADNDSTRLYFASPQGLFFSSDGGDTWASSAGIFGQLQTTALGYGDADGHTILYAATNGGTATATTSGASAQGPRRALATLSRLVGAGVYRYVVVTPKVTLKLSGLSRGALRLGRRVKVRGVVTPAVLAGSKVKLQVQRRAHRWTAAKTVLCTIRSGGSNNWSYKPAKKGSYRLRVTLAKTANHMGASTTWRAFKVK